MRNLGSHMLEDWLAREERTHDWLARQVGVTQPTVSSWIRGEFEPRIGVAISVAKLTGVPVESWVKPLQDTDAADASCTQSGTGEQVGT